MRALRDILIPKFVEEDLPIAISILKDNFPGLDIPKRENKKLNEAIEHVLKMKQLQSSPEFVEKMFEVHDTMNIRHANLLIGSSGVGKTTMLHTLAQALTKISEKVNIYTINPKAVELEDLYGSYDRSGT